MSVTYAGQGARLDTFDPGWEARWQRAYADYSATSDAARRNAALIELQTAYDAQFATAGDLYEDQLAFLRAQADAEDVPLLTPVLRNGFSKAEALYTIHTLTEVQKKQISLARTRDAGVIGDEKTIPAFREELSPGTTRTFSVLAYNADDAAGSCYMLAEQGPAGMFFCLSHRKHGGPSPTNNIEMLAAELFDRLAAPSGYTPDTTHFFIHQSCRIYHELDRLCRVSLTHDNGAFFNPRWQETAFVPRIIFELPARPINRKFDLNRPAPTSGQPQSYNKLRL